MAVVITTRILCLRFHNCLLALPGRSFAFPGRFCLSFEMGQQPRCEKKSLKERSRRRGATITSHCFSERYSCIHTTTVLYRLIASGWWGDAIMIYLPRPEKEKPTPVLLLFQLGAFYAINIRDDVHLPAQLVRTKRLTQVGVGWDKEVFILRGCESGSSSILECFVEALYLYREGESLRWKQ